ncbi:Hint domain-containing protein [Ruegeria intermedia]|uniref:Hint domain-containing protein n=1 Tax=Ruegeria intermedia TaxID=996115 RepID=A0A1M4YCB1_9RHOB|nr:Hint domain-containing protein [Ruegeria intermedia]SHF03471.1 Hint domain-containing protein [Ruegeria intermedia]
MVQRSFFAQDSESLIVTSSSNASIVGNPIINNSDTPNGTIFQYSAGTGATITLDDRSRGQAAQNVFNDDQPSRHVITDGKGMVANGTQVESESIITVRALDANGNPTGPEIDIYVFSQNGQTSNVWGYATSDPLVSGTSYIKVSGSNTGSSRYSNFVACFGPGTMIRAEQGEVPIEDIIPGHKVWTRDAGLQVVRWVGHSEVEGAGAFAPVVFAPGVIGNTRELVLSPQHRVLVAASMAEMLFGESEVLVAAKHLCGLPGVARRRMETVRYTHFMFDRHQLVRSNGALTESFFLAENSVSALSSAQRDEILALFPDIDRWVADFGPTAAMSINTADAALLRAHLHIPSEA